MTDDIATLTEKYHYYLKHGLHEAATVVRRRLNRLVIRREAGDEVSLSTSTRWPSSYSETDSPEYGDGSTTLSKEYPALEDCEE